jgi:hypothetical protein
MSVSVGLSEIIVLSVFFRLGTILLLFDSVEHVGMSVTEMFV